jgi:hypothetical protein
LQPVCVWGGGGGRPPPPTKAPEAQPQSLHLILHFIPKQFLKQNSQKSTTFYSKAIVRIAPFSSLLNNLFILVLKRFNQLAISQFFSVLSIRVLLVFFVLFIVNKVCFFQER